MGNSRFYFLGGGEGGRIPELLRETWVKYTVTWTEPVNKGLYSITHFSSELINLSISSTLH